MHDGVAGVYVALFSEQQATMQCKPRVTRLADARREVR